MISARQRILRGIGGAAGLGCLPLAWCFADAILTPGPSVCAFRQLTGHDCIFCGLTRAVACAELGDWRAALACHPLWPLALAIGVALAVICLADAWTGGDRAGACARWLRRHATSVILALLVLSIARGWWLPSHGPGAAPHT